MLCLHPDFSVHLEETFIPEAHCEDHGLAANADSSLSTQTVSSCIDLEIHGTILSSIRANNKLTTGKPVASPFFVERWRDPSAGKLTAEIHQGPALNKPKVARIGILIIKSVALRI